MPRGPLADDWLFWDAETISAYPHSRDCQGDSDDVWTPADEPEQLELFDPPQSGATRP
jgi:hypothetical protein